MSSDLDRYKHIATLGAGGMSTVELAEDTVLGRRVALKRVHRLDDLRAHSRLRREALIGASLTHPNLVSIFDILTTEDGDYVIVMEYVEGETLAQSLRRHGKPKIDRALEILTGVGSALDAIHAQRIVHRDVKPGNILLGVDGTVKLADLGIAAVPDRTRITTDGSVLGTFAYMAPEQLEGAVATPGIDVYGLAAVAFEVLSGKRARNEPNPVALARAVSQQPPPDLRLAWPEAPEGAAEVLIRGMCRDPKGRPRSAGELTARLRAAFEPQTTAPIAPPPARVNSRGAAAVPVVAPRTARPAATPQVTRSAATPQAARPARPARPMRTPAPTRTPPPTVRTSRRRSRPLALALVGLALAAVVAAVVIAATSSGSSHSASGGSAAVTHHPRTHKASTSSPASSSSSTAAGGASTGSGSASGGTGSSSSGSSGTGSGTASTAAPGGPVAAVESFYHLAAAHDYSSAWALADPAFRAQLGGYASFAAGQAADRSITFTGAGVTSQSPSSATVEISTTSVRDNGTHFCSGPVSLVRGSSGWLLDHIDIGCS